jgi:hypothetical protein
MWGRQRGLCDVHPSQTDQPGHARAAATYRLSEVQAGSLRPPAGRGGDRPCARWPAVCALILPISWQECPIRKGRFKNSLGKNNSSTHNYALAEDRTLVQEKLLALHNNALAEDRTLVHNFDVPSPTN